MSDERTNLWAPWRIDYIRGLEPASDGAGQPGCFLCDAASPNPSPEDMDRKLLLINDDRGVLMLNRYPYTNGHLLVAPHDHVGDLSDLVATTRAGLMELAELGSRLLKQTMNPQGMNVGMNLGRSAGAGVPGHLHLHVVPRWQGDVNFMDVVGGIRVIPQAIEESYAALKGALDAS